MKRKIRVAPFILGVIFVIALTLGIYFLVRQSNKYVYPVKFYSFVEKYSTKVDIDKNLIYGIINTESGFDENALSNVGARGLMQIMPDTFDWIKFKMNDERDITFDDMYNPETNIQYGVFLIDYLYERFGDIELAIAGYHAVIGKVDSWIENNELEKVDGSYQIFPSDVTGHYVDKVMDAYSFYSNKNEN